ncbi:MAG TPA: hypothetical protein VM734_08680 [Kofleriaceae bacterium]|nr:hypothetical protein [Kofleriaceae bacterium]
MVRALAAAVVVLAACGGAQRPADAGPSCDAVADHLLRLAEQDSQAAADPSLAAGIQGEAAHQCREQPWSAARRTCLLAAQTHDQTVDCPRE